MSEWLEWLGRRFARLATRAVVAEPRLWSLFRRPLRAQFDLIASSWEGRGGPDALGALDALLDRIDPPRRALDLGAGTGKAARLLARRFPQAEVVGVDLAPAMVQEARGLLDPEFADRVRFDVADASALPFGDGEFDLVVLLNMIPFFPELARVTAPGGALIFASYSGPATPIYVPPETLRARLEPLGFGEFEEVAKGDGTGFLARRRDLR